MVAGQEKKRVKASLQEDRGYWVVLGRVFDPETGKTRQRSKSTGLPTKGNHKREAQEAMREIVKQWEDEANRAIRTGGPLFGDYVRRWLERKEKLRIKQTTLENYRDHARLHIMPRFGNMPVAEITVEDLEDFYTDFLTTHTVNTAKKVNLVVSGAFREAIKEGIIPTNPADSDHMEFPHEQKFEGAFYTEKEVAALLAAARQEGEPIYAAVVLAALYGLRRSEVLGLRWQDVDFVKKTLTISNTFVTRGHVQIEEVRTKTKESHRVIDLVPSTVTYLQELKKGQQAAGIVPLKVVAWPDGNQVRPDYITRKTQQVMEKAGLPVIRFHDLRHTAASLLAPMVSPQQLQHFMGHSDISVTFGTYAHFLDRERRDTSAKMEQIIGDSGISL